MCTTSNHLDDIQLSQQKRSNSPIDQFFNMKKINKSDFGLPLNKFIKNAGKITGDGVANFIMNGVSAQTKMAEKLSGHLS